VKQHSKIAHTIAGKKTRDGAGVSLTRILGNADTAITDPFLLLDHFGSSNPNEYLAGFPWHPHRGIETITYMIHGSVEHQDSMGNKGVISSGDIQWMTAGSGIIHQEMPLLTKGYMHGFQLWLNLPARKKMTAPRYRGFTKNELPEFDYNGAHVKIIAGSVLGHTGPVTDLTVDAEYMDVLLDANATFTHEIKPGHRAFVCVYEGDAAVSDDSRIIKPDTCAVFTDESEVLRITAKENPVKFIMFSGAPIKEPVSWCGPIVMNTEEECETAFEEYEKGTFVK
jgi:hypothetical protein